MPSERTPLTKENLVMASNFMTEKATSLADSTHDGNSMPLRLLTILGGLAMLVSSVMGLFGKAIFLDFIGVFVECLCAVFGVLIVLLEVKDKLPTPVKGFEEFIETRCKFLESMTGKACLYGLSGFLKILQTSLINLIVGAFMCFLAVTTDIVGRKRSEYSEMVSIAV